MEIAALTRLPGWELLTTAVKDARDRWFLRFGEGLATSERPVDQREVDEKRGYWKGALWALERLPQITATEYQRFVEEAMKEADSTA